MILRQNLVPAALAAALLAGTGQAATGVEAIPPPETARSLPLRIVGRVSADETQPLWWRQWPGTYFEARFKGKDAGFRLGPGDAIVHVLVDDREIATLVKPAPGFYALSGLNNGGHRIRLEIASESGAGPTSFGAFFALGDTKARETKPRRRQIEFIGDSHTVGYGNSASKRDCTTEEVWAATDTSRTFGALLGRRYHADYRIHAISGRGIVRNYNGGGSAADTLPALYPYLLFDARTRDPQTGWSPQVIVIALGTNDFSTALHPDEAWPTREALHTAYEERYVRFVQDLRARNPDAHFILWATDAHDGEIASEAARVADQLHALGETRLSFVTATGLDFSACHSHPSLADDARIADLLRKAIGKQHGVWRRHQPDGGD